MNLRRRFAVSAAVAAGYGAVAVFVGVPRLRIFTLSVASFLAAFGLLTPMGDVVSSDAGIRYALVTKGVNAVLILGLIVMFVSLVA